MPAGLPGATLAQQSNPSQGAFVTFDLLSGPKGSPFDKDGTGNFSTGALATGIGFNALPVMGTSTPFAQRGYTDDYTPGQTKPDGTPTTDSTYMYIGGGRSNGETGNAATRYQPNPYTAGYGIGGAGNGGSRDAGAGPAFTGFSIKCVTATGAVANGAVVETGFANRSGLAMTTGQSTFGSNATASAAVA
ncbi:hypothetical protein GCM10028796_46770 [Ramlibacter monticola]|uniref:Uncharacterized protein n=1 Tax=Ramlibacter monticola TaxID=1926872 RepID=A0A936Z4P5_9BURK|nr:hypothetical protein [Ramlibacter monticola]MBL0394302.1 hypothetical protein [Ramlibacter monticola]